MSVSKADDPNYPYSSDVPEPLPRGVTATEWLSANLWPLFGALLLTTLTGLWLLLVLAHLFAQGGTDYAVPMIVEGCLALVLLGSGLSAGALYVDTDDEADRRFQAALLVLWAHFAVLLLATVAVTVFT